MGSKKHKGGHQNNQPKRGQGRGAAPGRPAVPDALVGVIQDNQGVLEMVPCAKKDRRVFALDPQTLNGAKVGDIILAKQDGATATGTPIARIEKNLGTASDPGILSLISAYEKGLRIEFNQATLDQTQGMDVPSLNGRADLRQIPLVTIDGADARDFDDAVFAERTQDGYHLIVAIADVSWYVRPGSELDKEALQRGNSTYFADRVLPMLPEALSNGLCSLKPKEDRACIAAHLWIDDAGQLQKYKFERALMNSHARLTYPQVQAAKDGRPDALTAPLMKDVISPLYEAYDVLNKARIARNALTLDGQEHKADIDRKTGVIKGIAPYQSHESNKLIEEFMILANVAAASALESKGAACVYRTHDRPISADRVQELGEYLSAIGIPQPKSTPDQQACYNEIMVSAKKRNCGSVVQDAILRIQAKAAYQTMNVGHFGLALDKYAHFTSPIRRYADLLVHRSLVDAFNMGAGGLDTEQSRNLDKMAKHISETEIASTGAERTANDRFAATYLAPAVGQEFSGVIQSATMAGLFVKFDGLGAVGLLPWKSLPRDNYRLDEVTRSIVGQNHVYRAGAKMDVRIASADGLKGSLVLYPANNNSADLDGVRQQGKKRGGYQPS
jgi:ribonuclease R